MKLTFTPTWPQEGSGSGGLRFVFDRVSLSQLLLVKNTVDVDTAKEIWTEYYVQKSIYQLDNKLLGRFLE